MKLVLPLQIYKEGQILEIIPDPKLIAVTQQSGEIIDAFNQIKIDPSQPISRQAETLNHELLHTCGFDNIQNEKDLTIAGERYFGVLIANPHYLNFLLGLSQNVFNQPSGQRKIDDSIE